MDLHRILVCGSCSITLIVIMFWFVMSMCYAAGRDMRERLRSLTDCDNSMIDFEFPADHRDHVSTQL
jgi:hypothetical protein